MDKDKKIRVRGGHRAHLKKLSREVDMLMNDFNIEQKTQLIALKQSLERKMTVMAKLDEEILVDIDEDDDIDQEIEGAEEIQTEIQAKIIQVEHFLKDINITEKPTGNGTMRVPPVVKSKIKLPKIEIRRFDGDPKGYRTFRDSFEVSVNKESSLSDVEKFTYLQGYLTGEALSSVRGLSLTDSNYKEALEILDERYGNKQLIVNSHMNELVNIPTVTNIQATKKIRELYDKVETNLRSLQAIGVDPKSYGCLLVPILKAKLPPELNLIISRKFDSSTDVWQIEEIMKELKAELMARERCEVELEGIIKTKYRPSTTEVLINRVTKSCAFCEGDHYSDQCRVVTDIGKRKDILRRKNRCFRCTRAGHISKECRGGRTCFLCKGLHHTSICDSERKKFNSSEKKKDTSSEATTVGAALSDNNILLQTARVEVFAANMKTHSAHRVSCKLLLDSGSQRSYILKKAANVIGAPSHHREKLKIGGFGGHTAKCDNHTVVEVNLQKNGEVIPIRAIVVEKICTPVRGQEKTFILENFPEMSLADLADSDDCKDVEIQMLIGMDHYWDIVTGEVVRGKNGLVAVSTKLGYVLSGTSGQPQTTELHTSVMIVDARREQENLSADVKTFWELESIGIKDQQMDDRSYDFNIKMEKKDGRYYVELPWKKDHPVLCDNYSLARKRLSGTLTRLRKDPVLMKEYHSIMQDQENRGIIEEVNPKERSTIGKTYYMPHHAVIKEDKETTKVRVVYDASSKSCGASLNESLNAGRTTFTDLFAVIVRFRCYKVAVLADIEKAFLSIGVKESDRDALRFLWVDDPTNEMSRIRHMRFARVCFGVVSSMAQLDATVRHHLQNYKSEYPDVVKKIEDSLYIDDLSSGEDDADRAFTLYKKSKEIFKEAAMNIRKWKSNDEGLIKRIRQEEKQKDLMNPENAKDLENKPCTKVLGIPWDTKTDVLKFGVPGVTNQTQAMTKRNLLRFTASIFDPLGVLSPAVLKLKVLFQKACSSNVDWDDPLDTVCLRELKNWLLDAQAFKGVEISRCYISSPIRSMKLVGFCDASGDAYAAVIYCICVNGVGQKATSFVASKTRVAPLPRQSIPRLELLGAVILSRLMSRTEEVFGVTVKIDEMICLTDSEVVLNWIQCETKTYKQFVQNRVNEIRRNTKIKCWFHVPGVENIADLPSRGCYPTVLTTTNKEHWIHGPRWLSRDIKEWPIRQSIKEAWLDPELKFIERDLNTNLSTALPANVSSAGIDAVIEPQRHGSFNRLLRVTAWCLRFIENCRIVVEVRKRDELEADELERAKVRWIMALQKNARKESEFEKRSQSLGVYQDEQGILRCRGRIKHALLSFKTRFPMLLPTKSIVTDMIIYAAHEKVYHNGVKETLAEIRSAFWIVRGRQAVKRVLKKCFICRKLEGLAYPSPITADLPKFRVTGGKTFETAGVDFCGPVFIKETQRQKTEMVRAYIVVFTCASSRLVHLELAPDLTTATYIRAQRRFISRYGIPSMMVSDNGKTFKGKELRRFNTNRGIRWRFNLPRAPWWGGLFERMVRSTKRCLKKAVGSGRLSYEELLTTLAEVETVINNRPLTYLEEEDVDSALTPSHLHCGRRTLDAAEAFQEYQEINKDEMVDRMKQIQHIVQHFWRRWSKEYLVELRNHHRIRSKCNMAPIEIGDVVLIHEDNVKRNLWRMGRITRLINGGDGVTRGAELQTVGRSGKQITFTRPLQRLIPMEISDRNTFPTGADNNVPTGPDKNVPTGPDNTFPTGADNTFPTGADNTFPTGADNNVPTGADNNVPTGPDNTFPTGADNNVPTGPDNAVSTGAEKFRAKFVSCSIPRDSRGGGSSAMDKDDDRNDDDRNDKYCDEMIQETNTTDSDDMMRDNRRRGVVNNGIAVNDMAQSTRSGISGAINHMKPFDRGGTNDVVATKDEKQFATSKTVDDLLHGAILQGSGQQNEKQRPRRVAAIDGQLRRRLMGAIGDNEY